MYKGTKHYMGLGSADLISLEEARNMVIDARRLMLLHNTDPLEARRNKQTEQRKATTSVSDVLEQYLTTHAKRWSRERVQAEWRQSLLTHLPAIMSLPIVDLTTERVVHALKPIWTTRNKLAERLRWRLESVWNFAKVHGLVTGDNPCIRRGSLEHILPNVKRGERVHHEALPYQQVGALLNKLAQQPTSVNMCLQYIYFVAARSGEARGLRWDEVDFATKVIRIPGTRTKTKAEHLIPMSTQVVALLEAQQAQRKPNDTLVFPGLRSKPLNEASLIAALRRLNYTCSVHGARASFRSFVQDQTEYPRDLAEQALGHSLGAVEFAYARGSALERRRAMMQTYADYCSKGTTAGATQDGTKRT